MKKIILSVLFLFIVITCRAQIFQKNKVNKHQIIFKQEKLENTQIFIKKNARPYVDFIPKAISKPGLPILVQKNQKILKLKPIFKKLIESEEKLIVYDDLNKKISFIEIKKQKEETSYLILFALISIIFMILSNILSKRNNKKKALVAAIAAAIAAFILDAFVFSFFLAFAFVSANFVVVVLDVSTANKYKNYKFYSLIYYILMIIYFIIYFDISN